MFVPLRIPAVSAGGGGVPVELGPTPCQLPDPEHAADIGEPLRASAGYAGPRFLQALGRKVQDRGLRLDQLRYELHCVRAGAQCQEQTIALLDQLRLPFGRLQSQRIDALVSQALSVRLPHTPAANDHNTVRRHGRTLEIRSAEACGTIYGFEIIKDGGVQQFTPSSIALDQLLHHGARYLGQSLSLHYDGLKVSGSSLKTARKQLFPPASPVALHSACASVG